ncbi:MULTISPECIES: hypothetical protein [unclassified Butyrivibrio]|uniref:hypothetical protein n=1 Tax=unclassified Butyrivibrio TaxID=2639466 RepID=UPI0003B6E8EE|nr:MULTISPECIES: hypothetical protein [unclassified Butyrivibrio]MBO6196551.1 FeoB-associated Cys-rich membrane protein [Butyrivibrio sp.]
MASIIGNAVVVIALAVIVFFSGRATIKTFKKELRGEGCSGCSGGNCSCCSKCASVKK